MPLDPRRMQAVFLEATARRDRVDRAAILDRECSADLELRQRVEALLRAHDEFNSFANDLVAPAFAWMDQCCQDMVDPTFRVRRSCACGSPTATSLPSARP
jgi:hypothetical protein